MIVKPVKNKLFGNILPFKTSFDDLIRLGSKYDGGYVVSQKALDESDTLYTYGVSYDYNFEKDYITLYPEKSVKMFDHTVFFSKNPSKNIYFKKKALEINKNTGVNSFIEHVKEFNDDQKKIFLKIDVEGYEFEYFSEALNNLDIFNNITGMAIEFHALDDINNFSNFEKIIKKLSEKFCVNHLHMNNIGKEFIIEGKSYSNTFELSFCNLTLADDFDCKSAIFPLTNLDNKNGYWLEDFHIFI